MAVGISLHVSFLYSCDRKPGGPRTGATDPRPSQPQLRAGVRAMHPRWSTLLAASLEPYLRFEPAYALFNVAQWIVEQVNVNLYLQKACRRHARTQPDLRTPCDDERAGVDFVATVNAHYTFASTLVSLAASVLLAAWSDKGVGRRKSSILWPMAVQLLQLLVMCSQSYWWRWSVWIAVGAQMAFNSTMCVRATAFVYMFSVSSADDRTARVTLLYVLEITTQIIGAGSSGYLLRNLGFFNVYLLCAGLTLASIVYLAAFVRTNDNDDEDDDAVAQEGTGGGCLESVRQFFDVRSLRDAFKMVYCEKSGNERILIVLLSSIDMLAWGAFIGESSVLYLYLRYKFGWNEEQYGVYVLYKSIGVSIGSLVCVAMNKYFRVSDSGMGTFAALWDIVTAVCYFFAFENWQLYSIPLLDVFHGYALVVCETMLTKFFESHQFGRVYSVLITLSVVIAAASFGYNVLFKSTMDYAPGSIFLLSAVINSFIFILYGLSHFLMRRMQTSKDATE